jgi:hypothetical protein
MPTLGKSVSKTEEALSALTSELRICRKEKAVQANGKNAGFSSDRAFQSSTTATGESKSS